MSLLLLVYMMWRWPSAAVRESSVNSWHVVKMQCTECFLLTWIGARVKETTNRTTYRKYDTSSKQTKIYLRDGGQVCNIGQHAMRLEGKGCCGSDQHPLPTFSNLLIERYAH